MNAHDLVRYPVNTEKARRGWVESEKGRWYTFIVPTDASKPQIRIAVEQVFNVHVKSVNTMHRPGKFRRRRMRGGYTPETKHAIVHLAPGEKIAFFEGI